MKTGSRYDLMNPTFEKFGLAVIEPPIQLSALDGITFRPYRQAHNGHEETFPHQMKAKSFNSCSTEKYRLGRSCAQARAMILLILSNAAWSSQCRMSGGRQGKAFTGKPVHIS